MPIYTRAITVKIAPAWGPPQWEKVDFGTVYPDDQGLAGDPFAQPEPEYELDQRATW